MIWLLTIIYDFFFFFFFNDTATTEIYTLSLHDALPIPASSPSKIDAAFGTFIELRAGALVVAGDPFLFNRRAQIVALAARHAVPAIYAWREFATAGGLMSYGTDIADASRLAGEYI